MKIWHQSQITINGQKVQAVAPLIISASRSTDIPAFYSKWLIDKFKRGYLIKRNPFNNKPQYIDLKNVRVIVFWTKFAAPIMKHLEFFDGLGINYYFLYTVNDYPEYEPFLPSLDLRIENFLALSQRLGKQRVLWRFDPLILSQNISARELLNRIYNVGEKLHRHTTRLIFSFVELNYRKVQINLRKNNLVFVQPSVDVQKEIVAELKKMTGKWQIELRSCASKIDFSDLGIKPNKCIDDELMVKLWPDDKKLMDFLGYSPLFPYKTSPRLKDKGQRPHCLCVYSKDIGKYNTCPHGCVYCYANSSRQKALENFKKHRPEALEI